MSSSCCLMAFGLHIDKAELKNVIRQEVETRRWGVFFDSCYLFPNVSKNTLIIDFADDFEWNNCERLVSPDNDWVNGEPNPVSFLERMQELETVMKKVAGYCDRMELYIGDGGQPADFLERNVELDGFAQFMEDDYNDWRKAKPLRLCFR